MMRLAIRGTGDKETGKKLIEILELLGGVNKNGFLGDHYRCFYYIDDDNLIWCEFEENMIVWHYTTHTLESFNKAYPYRPGDNVQTVNNQVFHIKGFRWSNGTIVYDGIFTSYLIPIESSIWPNNISHKIETMMDLNKFEETYKYNYPIEGMYQIKTGDAVYYDLMDGYEVVEENGAVNVKKIEPVYPKTYEECCNVFGLVHGGMTIDTPMHYSPLIIDFTKLLICRDAYWKLAGNWKPNWNEANDCIINWNNEIKCEPIVFKNVILAFPNEEMRDAFYENFKDMIERCKMFI